MYDGYIVNDSQYLAAVSRLRIVIVHFELIIDVHQLRIVLLFENFTNLIRLNLISQNNDIDDLKYNRFKNGLSS